MYHISAKTRKCGIVEAPSQLRPPVSGLLMSVVIRNGRCRREFWPPRAPLTKRLLFNDAKLDSARDCVTRMWPKRSVLVVSPRSRLAAGPWISDSRFHRDDLQLLQTVVRLNVIEHFDLGKAV